MRYLCFFHTDWILKNSHTYQEYKEVTEEIQYKVRKKRMKKLEVIEYYWFVAIVNNNKNRVKIVVSKNQYWKLEFVSVIPKWKSEEYGWVKINWLFFDENEDD